MLRRSSIIYLQYVGAESPRKYRHHLAEGGQTEAQLLAGRLDQSSYGSILSEECQDIPGNGIDIAP